jgi:arylamine N-acetyltransferase
MTVRVARQNRVALNAQDDHMDTTNGATLGGTVHDMAATLEVLSAQVHLNTQEVLEARAMAEEAHSYVRRMVEEDHLHRRLPE